jgi:hypothetical protein
MGGNICQFYPLTDNFLRTMLGRYVVCNTQPYWKSLFNFLNLHEGSRWLLLPQCSYGEPHRDIEYLSEVTVNYGLPLSKINPFT